MNRDTLDKVAYVLVLIGGLNWGVLGLFETDMVGELFGYGNSITEFIYILIGAAALYLTYKLLAAKTASRR